MKRVLFVSTSTTLGGAEKTLYTLATLLDCRKYGVAGIVSLKPFGVYAQKLKAAGFATFTLDLQDRPAMADLKRLSAIVQETKPDLVHAVMFQAIQLSRLLKRARPSAFRLVSSPRVNYRTRSLWTRLLDRALKGADDLLIAESRSSRDYLLDKMGYRAEKVRVVYNGIDQEPWARQALERRQKRRELRVADGDLLIGTAGRLDRQKGQDTLIEAAAKLKDLPVRWVILGEGPERGRLEDMVRRLGLEGRVQLPGERADLPSWLSALDVFALPSRWEGLPNSVLEALSAGLPVAASGVDGVCEIIQDGRTGLLVPPGEADALAEKLGALCRDADLRERLGAAGKALVGEKFSLRNMMTGTEDAYVSALAGA